MVVTAKSLFLLIRVGIPTDSTLFPMLILYSNVGIVDTGPAKSKALVRLAGWNKLPLGRYSLRLADASSTQKCAWNAICCSVKYVAINMLQQASQKFVQGCPLQPTDLLTGTNRSWPDSVVVEAYCMLRAAK